MLLRPLSQLLSLAAAVESTSWNYLKDQGSTSWDTIDHCGGTSQSPVDITKVRLNFGWEPLGVFDIIHKLKTQKLTLKLNSLEHAHSLKFAVQNPQLSDTLTCPQFHFHINLGEHTLNGKQFFGEYHLVCFRHKKYETLAEAVDSNEKGALAVLGFWLDISDDYGHEESVDVLIGAKETQDTQRMFDIDFPLPATTNGVFRYEGSLTTPPCSEVVTWSMFQEPVYVSTYQADILRNFEDNLKQNYRAVKPLNGREVTHFSKRWRVQFVEELAEYADQFGILPIAAAVLLSGFVVFRILSGISFRQKNLKSE